MFVFFNFLLLKNNKITHQKVNLYTQEQALIQKKSHTKEQSTNNMTNGQIYGTYI